MPRTYSLGLIALAALLFASGFSSCKKERPPNHPVSDMQARGASKIEVVEIVIKDAKRAELVKASYVAINDLAEETTLKRATHIKRIAELTDTYEISKDEVRAEVAKLRLVGSEAYQQYIALQLDIRKNTTAEEFAKLDGMK